jgi:hypothetical protein
MTTTKFRIAVSAPIASPVAWAIGHPTQGEIIVDGPTLRWLVLAAQNDSRSKLFYLGVVIQ